MGILTDRFPDRIASGAEGGHGHFQTGIIRHISGHETPNQEWESGKGRWSVSKAIELTGLHEVARSYFYKARGRFHYFRFKDWHDFICARTGDDKGRLTGSTTTWQMNKVYGTDDASFEYVRPMKRIVALTDQIWRNSTLQTRGTNYTIDNDTGIVTSAVSWAGSTLEMACQFDVLCRFEFDAFNPSLLHRQTDAGAIFAWDQIEIEEVREVDA